jgi:hypothetical protein
VEAAALLVFQSAVKGGAEAVEGGGRWGEEAVGVVVGAGDGLALDELADLVRGQAEAELLVAELFLAELIDHGPFMQAVAAVVGGAVEDVLTEGGDPTGELTGFFRDGAGVELVGALCEVDAVGVLEEVGVGLEVVCGDGDGLVERWEPLAEFAWGEVVVGEEEVFDGVFDAVVFALEDAIKDGGEAFPMLLGEAVPVAAGEGLAGAGLGCGGGGGGGGGNATRGGGGCRRGELALGCLMTAEAPDRSTGPMSIKLVIRTPGQSMAHTKCTHLPSSVRLNPPWTSGQRAHTMGRSGFSISPKHFSQ